MIKLQHKFHEARSVGLLLSLVGGALDGYTYIHFDAFASAQTGNLVLAIIQGFDGEWLSVGKKLLSTLFFFLGIFLAKFLSHYFQQKQIPYWRLFVLYYEAILFALLSLSWINQHPALVTILIAFTASIQWVTFDKIEGRAYTNLFTTGNLKGVATNLYDYLATGDQEAFHTFRHYVWVVVSFILGVILSVFCYHLWGKNAILLISFLLGALAVSQTIQVWRFYRTNPALR